MNFHFFVIDLGMSIKKLIILVKNQIPLNYWDIMYPKEWHDDIDLLVL